MSVLDQSLIKNFDLLTLEAKYKESISLIESAFTKFEILESNFKTYFAENYDVLPYEMRKSSCEDIKKIITKKAWYFILEKMQIRNFISSAKRKDLDEKIEKNLMPEFTAMNVGLFVTDAGMNISGLVGEMALEVYNFIKPNTIHKTNKYSKGMPKKVILPWIIEHYIGGGKAYISYHKKDKLKDLDNIFHLLDGKGVVKYPGDLITKIEANDASNEIETEYFLAKWYNNKNLHLTFKRIDLLNKLGMMATHNIIHS